MAHSSLTKLLAFLIELPFRVFPTAGQVALKHILGRMNRNVLLSTMLRQLPIESLTVQGGQGLFEGSAEDAAVIQRYATQGEWSPKTAAMIVDFFGTSRTGTYIDVGANIGLTSVPVAAAGINVVAFEPVPKNHAYLTRNIVLNSVGEKLTAHNKALLEHDGAVEFEISPSNHGDHRVRRKNDLSLMDEAKWKTVSVEATTLDSLADCVAGPIVLKIDTQGSEPLVIAGGSQICAQTQMLICEFSPYAMNRMQVDPAPLIELVCSFREVQLYERESEEAFMTEKGNTLKLYLERYCEDHKSTPIGRYLNLIAVR